MRPDEQERADMVARGVAVVARVRRDSGLIQWAAERGRVVYVDRRGPWGNPFRLGEDGPREDVCEAYARHYLPHKPSLLERLRRGELRGRVLVCYCHPLRCHGDTLAELANGPEA